VNNKLFVTKPNSRKFKNFGLLGLPSLYYRIFRKGIHKVIYHDEKLFVVVDHSIYILNFASLQTVCKLALSGKRPLCIEKYKDGIVYGEYYSNPNRNSVKIIHVDGSGVEHRLAELNGVRHIHSIIFNEYLKKYLVCTGDLDNESCMYAFEIDFSEHEKLLSGSQQYRIVQPACRFNKVYFGSDMPHSENSLYEFDLETKNVTRICNVPGPVFFSLVKGQNIYFATVVEPSEVNDQKFCHIFQLNQSLAWKNIGKFAKDKIPMRLGQYGQIMFPRFDNSSRKKLFFTEFATKNHLRIGSYDVT